VDDYKFYAIEVKYHPGGEEFHGHLDWPRRTTVRIQNPVRFAGWIFGKRHNIEKLVVCLSGRSIKEIAPTLTSADVAMEFPDYSGSESCRFNEVINFGARSNPFEITIDAVSADGLSRPFATLVFSPIKASERPVFIVGSPRSGTSILGFALQKAINPKSFSECHVIPLLHQIRQLIVAYYERSGVDFNDKTVMLSHVSKNQVTQAVDQIFKDLYTQFNGGKEWIDKTPGDLMLESIPLIQAVWPQAKFIFAKRRGIENVVSRLIKFSQLGFADHCRQWAQTMRLWKKQSKMIIPANYIMVDQYDIARRPDHIASSLRLFLDLTTEQGKSVAQAFKQEHPEQTAISARPQEREALDITELEWSSEQVQVFRSICGDMMQAYGYSETKSYYL
jgi:hypothetical protein